MEILGSLQVKVMNVLWHSEFMTVRQVTDEINKSRKPSEELAYTTILTVLRNLHKRQFVLRHSCGKKHSYHWSTSREGYVTYLVGCLARDLFNGDTDYLKGFINALP